MIRLVFVLVFALGLAAPPAAASGAQRGCDDRPRVVWQHNAPSGQSQLMALGCDGAAIVLTRIEPGQGGSELPRWGRQGTVYFDSDRAGLIHLFRLTAPSGRPVEQVTNTAGLEFSPAPTAGGRQLVFEHADADGTKDGLFVAPNRLGVTESSFRRLTASPAAATGGFDSDPDVSPDGRTVAFIRVLDAAPGNGRSAVFTVGIDGRGLRQLTSMSLNAIDPRWSPDGRWLAFSSNGDNFSATKSANIYLIRAEGAGLRQVTHETAGTQSFTPTWSPDGRRLLVAHAGPGLPGTQLRTMRLDGTHQAVLFQGRDGTDLRPDWQQPKQDDLGDQG